MGDKKFVLQDSLYKATMSKLNTDFNQFLSVETLYGLLGKANATGVKTIAPYSYLGYVSKSPAVGADRERARLFIRLLNLDTVDDSIEYSKRCKRIAYRISSIYKKLGSQMAFKCETEDFFKQLLSLLLSGEFDQDNRGLRYIGDYLCAVLCVTIMFDKGEITDEFVKLVVCSDAKEMVHNVMVYSVMEYLKVCKEV